MSSEVAACSLHVHGLVAIGRPSLAVDAGGEAREGANAAGDGRRVVRGRGGPVAVLDFEGRLQVRLGVQVDGRMAADAGRRLEA